MKTPMQTPTETETEKTPEEEAEECRGMTMAELQVKFREREERLKKNPPRHRPPRPQPPMTAEDREAERQAEMADCNKP
jgi:hypothetical protein